MTLVPTTGGDTLLVSSFQQTSAPLWTFFSCASAGSVIPSDLRRAAYEASGLMERVTESHPPRSTVRDLCRYLTVLRFALATALEPSALVSALPRSVLLLVSSAQTSMLLPALKADDRLMQRVRRMFFLLSTSEDPTAVKFPSFRVFLRTVLARASSSALPDEEDSVLDAVVEGEWRRLRTGAAKALPFPAFLHWVLETAAVLATSDRIGESAMRDVSTCVAECFETIAVQKRTRVIPESKRDPDLEAAVSQRSSRGTELKNSKSASRSNVAWSTSSELITTRFPQIRAALRPSPPDLHDTKKGINDKESVENMSRVLAQSKAAKDELTAKLLHTGAVRLIDAYPMKLKAM